MKTALLLFATICGCLAVIQSDYVSSMPEFPSNLNFSMYSGLLSLPYSSQKQIHYVFLSKAGSTSTFNDAPVILWLNGGPGCSSLDGLFMENGPFVFEDGQKDLNGTFNIWTWNQFANILYFESPAGVGFSPVSPGGTVYNDLVTTQDNYYALLAFFSGFPELLQNPFWVSGESYAGVYVPFLAAYIAEQNQLASALFINLQGVMVGNGVGSWDNALFTQVDFYFGHYLIPDSVYSQFYTYCSQSMTNSQCVDAVNQIDNLTALINPYDIYRYCYSTDDAPRQGWLFNQWTPISRSLKRAGFVSDIPRGTDVPCLYDAGINQYLNRADVKQALHVDPNINFVFCNSSINANYSDSPQGSVSKYQELIAGNYKVLIYSGDTDASVPYTTTLSWIENLNLGVSKAWRPWYLGDQVSGFIQEYNGITYVTVKGVGHQVPAWKRQEGATLIETFINGQELPYKTSSKKNKEATIVA